MCRGLGNDIDMFDRNRFMGNRSGNDNSSAIPLTSSPQSDFESMNKSALDSQSNQPQHASQLQPQRHDHDSGQSQRLQSPMRSMSLMEQDHSIDTLLAKELNKLSFRERNNINEEIHGVSSLYSVDETPQLISRSIVQLLFEIDNKVPIHCKVAYEKSKLIYNRNTQVQAEQQQPCSVSSPSVTNDRSSKHDSNCPKGYVNDHDFLLLFLRRELFVVHKAALRLVNFMELVYELWGESALTEKVWTMQSHLDEFELEVLRTGMFQCLQGRDRAGRKMLGNFAIDNAGLSVETRVSLAKNVLRYYVFYFPR